MRADRRTAVTNPLPPLSPSPLPPLPNSFSFLFVFDDVNFRDDYRFQRLGEKERKGGDFHLFRQKEKGSQSDD